MAKSFSNAFEVEMVAELVQYLIKGNSYDLGDIAVLVRDPFPRSKHTAHQDSDTLQRPTGSSFSAVKYDMLDMAQ